MHLYPQKALLTYRQKRLLLAGLIQILQDNIPLANFTQDQGLLSEAQNILQRGIEKDQSLERGPLVGPTEEDLLQDADKGPLNTREGIIEDTDRDPLDTDRDPPAEITGDE